MSRLATVALLAGIMDLCAFFSPLAAETRLFTGVALNGIRTSVPVEGFSSGPLITPDLDLRYYSDFLPGLLSRFTLGLAYRGYSLEDAAAPEYDHWIWYDYVDAGYDILFPPKALSEGASGYLFLGYHLSLLFDMTSLMHTGNFNGTNTEMNWLSKPLKESPEFWDPGSKYWESGAEIGLGLAIKDIQIEVSYHYSFDQFDIFGLFGDEQYDESYPLHGDLVFGIGLKLPPEKKGQ